jgi:transposase
MAQDSARSERTIRKTYKYRLNPTRDQEQALTVALLRCRTLYNVALEQRRTWWGRGHGKRATRTTSNRTSCRI